MNIKRIGIISFSSLIIALIVYLLIGNISFFKINKIKIESKMEFLNKKEIKNVLRNEVSRSFFTVDISSIQKQIESLTFVKQVKVSREWPNALKIKITEINPIAKIKTYNSDFYILADNCKFLSISGNRLNDFKNLTEVNIDKKSLTNFEKMNICNTYQFIKLGFEKINKALDTNIFISDININPINSVSCKINDDLIINLGKNADKASYDVKFSRLQNYIKKQRNMNNFRYIDLRYTNGIAAK